MADPLNELQKPAGAGSGAPSADEPVIHVIPERFYGAALKKKVGKLPPTPPPAAVPPPLPAGQAAVPTLPKPPAKKKSGAGLTIALIAAVLVLGGGAAAYFLYFARPATPVNQNTNAVANNNVNTTPPAVCGNAKCEAAEVTTCPADCAPAAICGNTKCEAPTETQLSCPGDCGTPAPVCGDNSCTAPTETTESCPADCKPPEPKAGTDSDSDGLTDEEETSVFGTNPNNPNSDADSYVDLNEALNLFDPAKPAPSSLADNPGFTRYTNTAQGYSMLRAAAWTVRESDAQSSEVFFNAPTGEFIEAMVQPKTEGQSLMDWYLAQAPGVSSSQVESFTTRQGYPAVSSPDRLTTYVDTGDNRVIIVTYNLGQRAEVQYKVLFQVMVHSLTRL